MKDKQTINNIKAEIYIHEKGTKQRHRQSHTSLELEKYVEVVVSLVLQPQGMFFHEFFFFLNINKFELFFFFLDVNHLIWYEFYHVLVFFFVGFDWIIMWKGWTIIRFNLGVEWWERESQVGVTLALCWWCKRDDVRRVRNECEYECNRQLIDSFMTNWLER